MKIKWISPITSVASRGHKEVLVWNRPRLLLCIGRRAYVCSNLLTRGRVCTVHRYYHSGYGSLYRYYHSGYGSLHRCYHSGYGSLHRHYHSGYGKSWGQSSLVPVPQYTEYITETQRDALLQHFDVCGKVKVVVVCGGCGGSVSRIVHAEAYREGTVLVRCFWCQCVCVLADHLNVVTLRTVSCHDHGGYDVTTCLRHATDLYNVVRLDKDTVEISSCFKDKSVDTVTASVHDECIGQHYTHVDIYRGVGVTEDGEVLEALSFEYMYWLQESLLADDAVVQEDIMRVPDCLSEYDWLQLSELPPRSRRNYYHKLFCQRRGLSPIFNQPSLIKREMKQYRTLTHYPSRAVVEGAVSGSLSGYTSGHDIVYDLGGSETMTPLKAAWCAQQMVDAWMLNSAVDDGGGEGSSPAARILYTHVKCRHNHLMRALSLSLLTPDVSHYVDVTSQHASRIYGQRRISMLCAGPYKPMPEVYDGEHVYVISCLLSNPLTQAKVAAYSKANNISLATFPFDKHLAWRHGLDKCLPLPLCHMILLTWMNTSSWTEAFKWIPDTYLAGSSKQSFDHKHWRGSPLARLDD